MYIWDMFDFVVEKLKVLCVEVKFFLWDLVELIDMFYIMYVNYESKRYKKELIFVEFVKKVVMGFEVYGIV